MQQSLAWSALGDARTLSASRRSLPLALAARARHSSFSLQARSSTPSWPHPSRSFARSHTATRAAHGSRPTVMVSSIRLGSAGSMLRERERERGTRTHVVAEDAAPAEHAGAHGRRDRLVAELLPGVPASATRRAESGQQRRGSRQRLLLARRWRRETRRRRTRRRRTRSRCGPRRRASRTRRWRRAARTSSAPRLLRACERVEASAQAPTRARASLSPPEGEGAQVDEEDE